MLGISTYFQDFDLEYIRSSLDIGIKYIFTSLHISEEDNNCMLRKLSQLINIAKEYQVCIIPDVSPNTLKKLKINKIDELLSFGLNSIRLDFGFKMKEIAELTKKFNIVLNASTMNEEEIIALKEAGADMGRLSVCHNYYPREDTGLSKEKIIKMNMMFKKYKLRILAFVPGDDLKRFPFYQGVPTLEKHRYMHPYISTIELLKDCFVDDVIIGDSKAKFQTLERIQSFMINHSIEIKAYLSKEYYYLYHKIMKIRPDMSEFILRIANLPRNEKIKQGDVLPRLIGCITIDNELYGRYSGEIQICKKDFPADHRVNIVGQIDPYWYSPFPSDTSGV